MSDRRARAGLFALALASSALLAPRAPVYWDAFGYINQSITGRVGGLALGRPLFVYASHGAVTVLRALGVSVWSVTAWLTALWALVAATAAPLTHAVARACGMDPRAALFAGAAVALSPALAHTAGTVLTDVPSLAVTLGAFVVALRGASSPSPARHALLAGALVGVAAGMREQAGAQGLVTLLAFRLAPRRAWLPSAIAMAAGFALAFAPPVLWAATHQRGYGMMIDTWLRGMRQERGQHPYTLGDFSAYLRWLLALGPLMTPVALAAWARGPSRFARWSVPAMAVCVPSLAQLAMLGAYQDISYSPRYLLSALPGALALPAGISLAGWTTTRARAALVWAALVAPVLIAAPLLRARESALVDVVTSLRARLEAVPRDAVVVTGQACPAVELVRRMAEADPARVGPVPTWERICPGWGWPTDLEDRLDRALAQGRTVVIDLRAGAWLGPRQQGVRAQVARWHASRRHPAIVTWR